MTYLDQQIQQMLDQIADYAGDWEECLNMVAEAETDRDKQMLHDYLETLTTRLAKMQRRFNIVTYRPTSKCWCVSNYDYKMYKWFKNAKFAGSTITPYSLFIHKDELNPEQNEQMNKMKE